MELRSFLTSPSREPGPGFRVKDLGFRLKGGLREGSTCRFQVEDLGLGPSKALGLKTEETAAE